MLVSGDRRPQGTIGDELRLGDPPLNVWAEMQPREGSSPSTREMYSFDDFSRLMGFEQIQAFEREHPES